MKIKGLDGAAKKVWAQISKNKYVLALLLVGAVLLLLPSGKSEKTDGETAEGTSRIQEVTFSLEAQEARLSTLLSSVEGAGKTEVMLTLKTSTEQILAQDAATATSARGDETQTENTVSTVILSGSGGLETTVTLKYIYPEYLGAVVLSEGAGNASVRLQLTQAVAAATGLSSDKITVMQMQNT